MIAIISRKTDVVSVIASFNSSAAARWASSSPVSMARKTHYRCALAHVPLICVANFLPSFLPSYLPACAFPSSLTRTSRRSRSTRSSRSRTRLSSPLLFYWSAGVRERERRYWRTRSAYVRKVLCTLLRYFAPPRRGPSPQRQNVFLRF